MWTPTVREDGLLSVMRMQHLQSSFVEVLCFSEGI